MKNYDEREILYQLRKKNSCRISGAVIEVSKDNYDIGKNTWRKIMYLCKCCGFRYMITNFAISKKDSKDKEFNSKNDKYKLNINAAINIM